MGGAEMPWSIALPQDGDTTGLPLVLALPGTDGTEHDVVDKLGLPGFATAAGLRACFVSVGDVDSSYYHPRADGTDFFSFIVDELIPMVEKRYGVGGQRTNRAVYGLSMGGFGALLIAQRRPDLVAAVVGSSPAVYPSYQDAITGHPGTFDSEADWQRWGVWEQTASMGGVPVRIDCGDADPFAPTARQLLVRIPHAVGGVSSGCHENSFWRRTAEVQLRFLAAHLSS
jgi:S-formylglutathione hydrolase FrmB